jgi:hypothetical protein
MKSIARFLAAALVLACLSLASHVAAIEFRLSSTSSGSGLLVFQAASPSQWQAIDFSSMASKTALQAQALCALVGYSYVASANMYGSSLYTTIPIGMRSLNCNASLLTPSSVAEGGPEQSQVFDNACSYNASTSDGVGDLRLFLSCEGVRDGGRIGFAEFSPVNYFYRFASLPFRVLEIRRAHSSTWGTICADTSSADNAAGMIARFSDFDFGSFGVIDRDQSGVTSLPRIANLRCSSSSAYSIDAVGACTYTSYWDGSPPATCTRVYTLQAADTTNGALVGSWWLKLSSYSSGYLRVLPAANSTVTTTYGMLGGCSLTQATADKVCTWLGYKYNSANNRPQQYRTTSRLSYRVFMSGLTCPSTAVTIGGSSSSTYSCSATQHLPDGLEFSDVATCSSDGTLPTATDSYFYYAGIYCSGTTTAGGGEAEEDNGWIVGVVFGCIAVALLCGAVAGRLRAGGKPESGLEPQNNNGAGVDSAPDNEGARPGRIVVVTAGVAAPVAAGFYPMPPPAFGVGGNTRPPLGYVGVPVVGAAAPDPSTQQ